MQPSAIAPARNAKPLALAVPGLIALGLAWSLALGAPPPDIDGGPRVVHDPRLSCDELSARVAAGEGELYAVLAGHLEETGEEGRVRLVCDGGGALVAHANANVTGTPGTFRAHVGTDGTARLVESCLRCEVPSARRVVPSAYRAHWILRVGVMGLGAIGVSLFVAGWRRRPFDPLRDLTRGRAPSRAYALARPSNDRVKIDGVEHCARALGAVHGRLAPTSEPCSSLVLPGAGASYREGAGGLAHVLGPATLATLRVRAGERAPLADGDRVELPGLAPFRVELPVPGTLARFFFGDAEHARLVGRFATPPAKLHAMLARVTGIGAIVIALLELPHSLVLGGALLAVASALAITLPRQGASARETRIPYAALSELTITESTHALGVAYRGREITWLPRRDEGELAGCVEKELRDLIAAAPVATTSRLAGRMATPMVTNERP